MLKEQPQRRRGQLKLKNRGMLGNLHGSAYWTNIIWILDKYDLDFGQINFATLKAHQQRRRGQLKLKTRWMLGNLHGSAYWTNMIWILDKYDLDFGQI